MTKTVLHIDASARTETSTTRALSADVVAHLGADTVLRRDLAADPLPQIDESWVGANFTPATDRTADQIERLSLSDNLIQELQAADTIVIGVPIYNFSVPTALKAWIDLVARAGVTFAYTENGPKGLLEGKRAVIVVASGGVPVGSPVDFATGYLRQFLNFIGITKIDLIAADQMNVSPEASLASAKDAVAQLAA